MKKFKVGDRVIVNVPQIGFVNLQTVVTGINNAIYYCYKVSGKRAGNHRFAETELQLDKSYIVLEIINDL